MFQAVVPARRQLMRAEEDLKGKMKEKLEGLFGR